MIVVEGSTLARAWRASVIRLLEEDRRHKCQWQDRETTCIRSRALIIVRDPLGEPRFHLAGVLTPQSVFQYRREVLEGLHGERLGGWGYSYHQRLFDHPYFGRQIARVIERLRECSYTRRAVAVTWDKEDHYSKYPPCILDVQAQVIDGRLDLICHMRSNDALKAAMYDMDVMIEIQRMIAEELGVEVGTYIHFAADYHIYEGDLEQARPLLRRPDAFVTTEQLRRWAGYDR